MLIQTYRLLDAGIVLSGNPVVFKASALTVTD